MKLHLPPRFRASLLTALLAVPTLLTTPASAETTITEDQTGGSFEHEGNVTLDGATFSAMDYIDVRTSDPEAGNLTLINGATIDGVTGNIPYPLTWASIRINGNLQVGASDGSSTGTIRDVAKDVCSVDSLSVTGDGSRISNVGEELWSSFDLTVSSGGVIEHVGWSVYSEVGYLTVSSGGVIEHVGGDVYSWEGNLTVSSGGVIEDVGGNVWSMEGNLTVSSGGVIEGVGGSVWSLEGDLTVTGEGSRISDVDGWVYAGSFETPNYDIVVSDGGKISDVGNLSASGNMMVNRGTLVNATLLQDELEQDNVGMVGGDLEISNGSSISTTRLQVAGAITVSDSTLNSATLTAAGGDIRLGAVSGSGSTIQTLCDDPAQGSHDVILTGDVAGEHTIISAADLEVQPEQGVCVSGSRIQVAGKVTGTALQLEGGSLTTAGTTLDTLELSRGASYTGTGTMQARVLGLGSTAKAAFAHLSTSTLRYTFLQTDATPLTLGSYSAAAGGAISIDLTSQALAAGDGTYTLLSLSGAGSELDTADFTLSSATLSLLGEDAAAELLLSPDGKSLLVTLSELTPVTPDEPITPETPTAGYYERELGSAASTNGRAGLRLADQATEAQTVQPGGDMELLLAALDEAIGTGNRGAADAIAAQLSGASATTLGMAFSADAQRHLNSIRNRLATMKVDSIGAPAADPVTGPEAAKMKPLSAWVNAEGSYQTMEQSGSAPGYSMTSWGGTVGVQGSPLKNLDCGLALTALYGDLDADARDAASGDLDTCYISAFGQYRHSAWSHTLVASLGLSDISLDRTVSHSQGSYRTSGDTDGVSLGLLYELAYDIPLNGGATTIIQPLVNLSYLHTTVDGYTETGSDAALSYGRQSMDSVSLGLGARIQSLTGASVFNRSALVEGRVLAKFNCGDRRSAASVGFANGIGLAGVESAEIGVFGVELGAGLTVPLGSEAGSIFVDASYELYSEYSNLNASVGYRLSF